MSSNPTQTKAQGWADDTSPQGDLNATTVALTDPGLQLPQNQTAQGGVTNQNAVGQDWNLAPDTLFDDRGDIELVGMYSQHAGRSAQALPKIIMLLVLVGLIAGGYYAYVELSPKYGVALTDLESQPQAVVKKPSKKTQNKKVVKTSGTIKAPVLLSQGGPLEVPEFDAVSGKQQQSKEFSFNNIVQLYGRVPNRYVPERGNLLGFWTFDVEQQWRKDIASPYLYVRLKTLQTIRDRRLNGAQELLKVAYWQKKNKFWHKMESLIGLIEYNEPVPRWMLRKVLKNENPHLVARYFKRFASYPSNAELYLARFALPYINPQARKHVMMAMANKPRPLNQLYFAAASYDPDPTISAWVERQKSQQKIQVADTDTLTASLVPVKMFPGDLGKELYAKNEKLNDLKPMDEVIVQKDPATYTEPSKTETQDAVAIDESEVWEEQQNADKALPDLKGVEFFDAH